MLIAGLNDSEKALKEMAAVLAEIHPDMIHLVMPTRPAPESIVGIPDEELVQRAVFILSSAAPVLNPAKGEMNLGSAENLLETLSGIASRHPVQERELEAALGKLFDGDAAKIHEAMGELLASGRFEKVHQGGELYWIFKSA